LKQVIRLIFFSVKYSHCSPGLLDRSR